MIFELNWICYFNEKRQGVRNTSAADADRGTGVLRRRRRREVALSISILQGCSLVCLTLNLRSPYEKRRAKMYNCMGEFFIHPEP